MKVGRESAQIIDIITDRIERWERLAKMYTSDPEKSKWEAKIEELENIRTLIGCEFY